MFNLDNYKKFNDIKYDAAKTSVYHLLKSGMKLEALYDFSIVKQLSSGFDDSYEEIWTDFVDYVKLLDDGVISNDGHLISIGQKSHYKIPENENSAWQTFKEHLVNKGIYTFEEINGLEKSANKILNNLSPDTKESGAIKGLVMGYVQSGKTNSIESLMTMAADYGYNVFIILSGIIENLRKQNLNRFRDDIEYAKNSNIHWEFIEQVTKATPKAYQLINSGKKIVIVSLKNSKRLANLRDWLFSSGDASLINAKVLVIDDEADQAGLNTKDVNGKDEERSKINKLITELIDNYCDRVGGMNYIGYTATPYGNFLNEIKSIYPKDFIYMLPKSPKYIGAMEIFGYEELSDKKADGLDIVRTVSNEELEELTRIESGEFMPLPNSLKDAICWFICTLATFRAQKKISPVTMLIHDNRKTANHIVIARAIKDFINDTEKEKLISRCETVYQFETNRFTRQDFYDVMSDYGREIGKYLPFEELKPYIEEILSYEMDHAKNIDDQIVYSKGINSVIDNSIIKNILDETEQPRLIYPDKDCGIDYATGFIVTGGDTLSRGLTLEGLTTSYFTRKSDTVDTLMQMGRWFGYRIGYELLPRLWIDDKTNIKFTELTKVEAELRNDLNKYELGTSPEECGPVILSTFNTRITSKSKMQSAIAYELDYRGQSSQTILFDKDEEIQRFNVELTDEFTSKYDYHISYNLNSNLVAMNIDFKEIGEYLRKFKFCAQSSFFNNMESFCDWIDNCNLENLKKWNLIVAGNGPVGEDGSVGKISRSKKIESDDLSYFNIAVLRRTTDIASDLDPDKYIIDMNDEKNIIEARSKYNTPQLIIYKIDGRVTPSKITKNRTPINMDTDIIGLYIYVPGILKKNNTHSIHINIPKKEEI